MSFVQLHIEPVDIGGGLLATGAWVSRSPIVLIETKRRADGSQQKSRLDLQKSMFIDPLPGERTNDGMRALVQSVVDAKAENSPD